MQLKPKRQEVEQLREIDWPGNSEASDEKTKKNVPRENTKLASKLQKSVRQDTQQ